MRASIKQEFGIHKPRAAVIDDHAGARKATARRLRTRGFEASEYKNAEEFFAEWLPGTMDVIIADWELSGDVDEQGERVLELVRKRDWDVPFVLVSGKLAEDGKRAEVLEALLDSGSARFVTRGDGAIAEVCKSAEDLIERRDLVLLKIILGFRDGALSGATIQTSKGEQEISEILEGIVSRPKASHDAGRPVAERRSQAATRE